MEIVARALRRAVERTAPRSDRPVVLFSGGIDSALLAHLLAKRGTPLLRTIGLAGSADLEAARSASALLGLPWFSAPLSDAGMRAAWDGWARPLRSLPEPRRSVLFTLGLAFERWPGTELWLGQGADELFGGYAHFANLSPAEAADRSRQDLDQLRTRDWPATLELARRPEVTLRAPYLDLELQAAVEGLDPGIRYPVGDRKGMLRAAARWLGLPEELALRPKRAMQYGTGVNRWLRTVAGRETDPPESRKA